jgi:nucleoside-diphosphate-sugar epimerase
VGYVGGPVVDILQAGGQNVTVYDNIMYESRFLKPVNFVRGDVRDTKKLSNILPDFETVIWLAALVGDGACQVDPFLTKAINEDAPKWLVDNFKGKIIFPSTCSVYGVNNELIDETAIPNPLSIYAETKLAAEQYILKNAKDPLVFRLGTLHGVGDHYSRIRLDLVVNVLTRNAVEGKTLRVFGGEQWRPLLHVRDVAMNIHIGLRKNLSGLYNLSEGNWTIKAVAEQIQEVIPNTKVEFVDMAFEDLRNYRVDTSRWTKAAGEQEMLPVRLGIIEMAQLVRENRIRDLDDPVYSNAGFINKHYWKM